ncbi:hypothetical protein BZG79_09605 [Salinivibrio sp. MA427]|uniref:Uncharacterized protein n=1 Tax=Salinivibrio costicola subsp. alcaliphilus TaxID=272773 RepID=A0ABX3KV80_SALCS|nr:hypothetical protein BZG76_04405 [Salinivibrio sp. AR647]OOE93549.1 hypothetical protein BZG75_07110 [Salinivibrio sp. AR640]OOF04843.1 hypothetical protein BZG81_08000 [Salinivibrio sp. MA607]OOF12098.1 hypothetical protein BZG79_09605 [Salinivibrio sp. MA427]OOF34872.1 hypothetical protein BZJ21_03270 [Salinivibrio costicola subsp. alcaliphilus]
MPIFIKIPLKISLLWALTFIAPYGIGINTDTHNKKAKAFSTCAATWVVNNFTLVFPGQLGEAGPRT